MRLVNQSTNINWEKKSGVYLGIDPTGKSLHVGHLLALQLAKELAEEGWKVVILLGGYTASIGDPSGKNKIRKSLSLDNVEDNRISLLKMLHNILPPSNNVIYVNNKDWLKTMNLANFLNYSKYLSVNKLSKLDTFANRLNNNLSLALSEFSYTLLQGIDFWHLYKTLGVTLQIGGQDQWGNISTGVHFVKKLHTAQEKKSDKNLIAGVTTPLLEINGKKIGKTTGHNLSLNIPSLNLFTNLYNLPDQTILQLLKFLMNLKGTDNNKENRYLIIEYIFKLSNKNDFLETKDIYIKAMQGIGHESLYKKEKELSVVDLLEKYLQISRGEIKRKIKNNAITVNKKRIDKNMVLKSGPYVVAYSKYQIPLFIKIS